MEIMRKSGLGLTVVDGFFVLLSMALIYGTRTFGWHDGCHPVVMIEPFLIAYCLFRILFAISHKWTSCLLMLLIAVFCTCELLLGYTQLFENLGKSRGQEICVGSFSNSGPFGCFLAICSSLFTAVYLKEGRILIRIPLAILVSSALMLMTCTLSRASIISFAVSMLFLAMKSDKISSFIRQNEVYISIAVVLLGTGAYLLKKPSADGRMLMARIDLRMIKENGLTGIGLGNYAGAYGKAQAAFFSDYMEEDVDDLDIDRIPDNLRMVADCPTFAFNEYLKTGIESGPVAMLLFVALVLAGISYSYRTGSIWCYPLITVSMFACFSYPFEVAILLLLFIICLASNKSRTEAGGKDIIFFALMLAVLIPVHFERVSVLKNLEIGTHPFGIKEFCGNRHKRYSVHGNGYVPDGLYDEMTLFAYGQSLSNMGNYAKSDSVLKLGTEISSDPMFWNVMGNNSLAQGKFREAEERYKHAFYMVPNRLYPLYLMARLYDAEGDTVRLMDMADKIDGFKAKIESINTRRLRDEISSLKRDYEKSID